MAAKKTQASAGGCFQTGCLGFLLLMLFSAITGADRRAAPPSPYPALTAETPPQIRRPVRVLTDPGRAETVEELKARLIREGKMHGTVFQPAPAGVSRSETAWTPKPVGEQKAEFEASLNRSQTTAAPIYYSAPSSPSHGSSGAAKTVSVKSYTRRDGTVVQAHKRSAPGSRK